MDPISVLKLVPKITDSDFLFSTLKLLLLHCYRALCNKKVKAFLFSVFGGCDCMVRGKPLNGETLGLETKQPETLDLVSVSFGNQTPVLSRYRLEIRPQSRLA